jgi:hypothetical protein
MQKLSYWATSVLLKFYLLSFFCVISDPTVMSSLPKSQSLCFFLSLSGSLSLSCSGTEKDKRPRQWQSRVGLIIYLYYIHMVMRAFNARTILYIFPGTLHLHCHLFTTTNQSSSYTKHIIILNDLLNRM